MAVSTRRTFSWQQILATAVIALIVVGIMGYSLYRGKQLSGLYERGLV